MGAIRPNWKAVFRKGASPPNTPDTSLPSHIEGVGSDLPEAPAGLEPLFRDPANPDENQTWLRYDKRPPEIRAFVGGLTWALVMNEVSSEAPEPLYPSASLRPTFYPQGIVWGSYGPLRPSATLYPRFYPRGAYA